MYDSFTVSREDEQGFDLAMRSWAPNMNHFGIGECNIGGIICNSNDFILYRDFLPHSSTTWKCRGDTMGGMHNYSHYRLSISTIDLL